MSRAIASWEVFDRYQTKEVVEYDKASMDSMDWQQRTDNKAAFSFLNSVSGAVSSLHRHPWTPFVPVFRPPWPSPARSRFLSLVSLAAAIFSHFLFEPPHCRLLTGPLALGLIRKTPPGRRLSGRPKLHRLDEINFREQTGSLRENLRLFIHLRKPKSHVFLIIVFATLLFRAKVDSGTE